MAQVPALRRSCSSHNDVFPSGKVIVACDPEGVPRTAKVRMTLPADLDQIPVDAHARAGMVRAIGLLGRSRILKRWRVTV